MIPNVHCIYCRSGRYFKTYQVHKTKYGSAVEIEGPKVCCGCHNIWRGVQDLDRPQEQEEDEDNDG